MIFYQKFSFLDGSIQEMLIWKLPEKTPERPHGLKYSLYYGHVDGTCAVRYDNEFGKGDHRHIGDREEPYFFKDKRTLVEDFLDDIDRIREEE